MGIQGLATFIRSRAGHTMRNLPLTALHDRRVCIDGNILTLQFHHSNESQHPNRTILGWYRFIRNLQSYGIRPIVVFDGSKRVPAKARELERRNHARRLLAGRAESEEARHQRLRGLKGVVEELRALDPAVRDRTLSDTQRLLEALPTAPEARPRPDSIALGGLPHDALYDPATALSTRFAGLVFDMQASKSEESDMLSKTQIAIASSEAKAFTQALAVQAENDRHAMDRGASEEAEEEDPLNALQLVLEESRCVADKYAKRSTSVSAQTHTDCMDTIKAMGIPLLLTSHTEPQEAESLCSALVEASYADLVISTDTDVLAFESTLLRGLGAGSRSGESINGHEVRKELEFGTKDAWIDFCLLCGSDFTERIRGLGPIKAYHAMQEHGSIEAILASGLLSKKQHSRMPPLDLSAYMEEVNAARAIFANPTSVAHYSAADFELQKEDPSLLATLRGFGGLDLEKDDLRQHSGFERRKSFTADLDEDIAGLGGERLEEAFGFASLGDSPFPARR